MTDGNAHSAGAGSTRRPRGRCPGTGAPPQSTGRRCCDARFRIDIHRIPVPLPPHLAGHVGAGVPPRCPRDGLDRPARADGAGARSADPEPGSDDRRRSVHGGAGGGRRTPLGRVCAVQPSENALGIIFDKPDTATHRRLAALAITIVLGALLVTAVTAAAAISAFLHTHGLSVGWLVAQVGMLALLACFFLVCYLLLVPGRQQIRDFVPAALVLCGGVDGLARDRQLVRRTTGCPLVRPVRDDRNGVRRPAVPADRGVDLLAGAELAVTLPRRPYAGTEHS